MGIKKDKEETSVADQAAKLEQHMNEGKSDGKKPPAKTVSKKKAAPKKKAVDKSKTVSKKKAATKKTDKPAAKPKSVNAVVGKAELLKVDPKKLIVVWEDNPRADYGDMKTLEASIKVRGVENPVRVKKVPEGYKLEAGYRRTRACLNLIESGTKVASIPAILEKAGTTEKETLIHVFVENDGKAFNPMEEAVLFNEMKTAGMSEKEIGHEIGRAAATITRRLSLLKASPILQKALRDEKLSLRTASRILKANRKDHEAQEKMLADYLEATADGGKTTAKQARDKVAQASGITIKTVGVTQNKAKKLLDEIASAFTAFARTQKPANSLNKAWVDLESKLKKTRSMKRKGQFK